MPVRSCLAALTLLLAGCGSPALTASPPGAMEAVVVEGARGGRTLAYAERAAVVDGTHADRQLVRTAALGLELDDDEMPALRDAAAEIAEAFGGYVAADGPREMTLRIPDPQLEESLDALGALAKETRREVRAADVTDQYTDLEIRLANARALRDRLAALLEQAATVQEVLEVERELARVTTEVELLEGHLRALSDRVAFATVRLTLREGVAPGPLGYVFVGLYEGVKWLFVRD